MVAFRSVSSEVIFNGSSASSNLPAGYQAGDLLLAFVALAANTTCTTPAGWTLVTGKTSGGALYVFRRIATSSETAPSFSFGTSVSAYRIRIAAYSGVDATTPLMLMQGGTSTNGAMSLTVGTSPKATMLVSAMMTNGSVTWAASSAAGTSVTSVADRAVGNTSGNIIALLVSDAAIATSGTGNAITQNNGSTPGTFGSLQVELALNPDNAFAHVAASGSVSTSGGTLLAQTTPQFFTEGALALVFCRSVNAQTAPPGYTTIYNYVVNARSYGAYYKILTGTDTTIVAPTVASGTIRALAVVLVGHTPTSPIALQGHSDYASASVLGWPSLALTTGGTRLYAYSAGDTLGVATTDAGLTTILNDWNTTSTHGLWYAAGPTPGAATTAYTQSLSTVQTFASSMVFAVNGAYQPPSAPTLVAPANASYQDLAAAGVTFSRTDNFNSSGDVPSAYALRRKIAGAGSYEYWNAGTSAWQSTIVWNTSSATSVTFGAGKWTNGNVYNWSFATQSTLGPGGSGSQGPFAADNTVTGSVAPTVTVTAPTGTASSASPVASWTETLQSGAAQTAYRVVVESGTYGAAPGSGATVWDSGVVGTSAVGVTIGAALLNNTPYRVFVQITQTGGQTSAWAHADFTTAFAAPATPTLTATWDAANARAVLVVQGADNLLTADDASMETTLGTWVGAGNATVARSTAQSTDGGASMLMTATATANMSATTATGTAGYPVVAGRTYTGLLSFRAAVTARNVTVGVAWYSAASALLSTSTSATVGDVTTGFTQAAITAVAPAGAAFAAVVATVQAAAAGSQHYVDKASIVPGSSTAWTRGGLNGNLTYLIEESDDGGANWAPVRYASALTTAAMSTQTVTAYDYEGPPSATRTYRATTIGFAGQPTFIVTSAPSSSQAVTAVLAGAWLKDPLNPVANVALSCLDGVTFTRGRNSATLNPLGAVNPIVQVDTRRSRTFTVAATPDSQGEWDALDALLDLPARVLLLQRPAAAPGSWRGLSAYLVAAGDDTSTPLGNVPADTTTIAFAATEVAAP